MDIIAEYNFPLDGTNRASDFLLREADMETAIGTCSGGGSFSFVVTEIKVDSRLRFIKFYLSEREFFEEDSHF